MTYLAATISSLRSQHHMSQQELANRIGVSRSAIGMYESGQRIPPLNILTKIATCFHVSLDYLTQTGGGESVKASVFIERLQSVLASYDWADIQDSGLDIDFVERIIEGDEPLTIDNACYVADIMGESLDYLLGMTSEETIKAALVYEDSLTRDIINILLELPDEKKSLALMYLQLLSASEDTSSTQSSGPSKDS